MVWNYFLQWYCWSGGVFYIFLVKWSKGMIPLISETPSIKKTKRRRRRKQTYTTDCLWIPSRLSSIAGLSAQNPRSCLEKKMINWQHSVYFFNLRLSNWLHSKKKKISKKKATTIQTIKKWQIITCISLFPFI